MGEHDIARLAQMLGELQPWIPRASYEIGQMAFALFKRRTLEVTPIELQQIESEQVCIFFDPIASPQQLEHGKTLFIADHDLAVDQARPDPKYTDRRQDGRKQFVPFVAVSREQAD